MLVSSLILSFAALALAGQVAVYDEGTAKERTALIQTDKILQSLVIPGPTVVSLLGNLLVISTKKDFSLTKSTPPGGFKYVKMPDSFRATLVQITNEGWSAFNVAQKNMDKIQLFMQTIPVSVQTSMRIITKGSDRILKLLLPKSLNQISSIGDECVSLALETEDAFRRVMDLTGEVLDATVNAQGIQDQDLTDVKAVLNSTRAEAQQLNDYGKKLKERLDKLNKMAAEYRRNYEQAMNDIPSGWSAMFQSIAKICVHAFKSVFGGDDGDGGGNINGSANQAAGLPDTDQFTIMTAVKILLNQAQATHEKLKHIFKAGTFSGKDDPIKALKTLRPIIEDYLKKVKAVKEETALKIETVDQLQKGLTLADTVVAKFKGGIVPKDKTSQDSILKLASDIITVTQKIVKEQAVNDPTAINDKDFMPTGDGDDNAEYRAELAKQQMHAAEKRADKVFNEVLKYEEKLGDLMAEMAKLDFEKVDFKQILDLMTKGIDLLSEIRRQWSQLITFFSQISTRTEVTLKQTLMPFLEEAETIINMTGSSEGIDKDERQMFKDMLSEQAQDINGVAYFLYTVSSAYVDVSEKYLIDKLAGIAKMLQANSDQERQNLIKQINGDAQKSNDAIQAYIKTRHDEYKKKISDQVQKIDSTVKGG